MKSPRPGSWTAAAAAALLSVASLPVAAMEAFKASYQASAMGMVGEGQMSVSPQGQGRWQYQLQVKNQLVDLSQSTVFDEVEGRLRPLSSSDDSRIMVKQKSVDTVYDWGTRQATWSGDIKPERAGPVALQAGDMDALLVNLAIVRDVAAGRPLNYRLVENGKIKPMTYQVSGKEAITVQGKSLQATKVVRNDGDKQMVVWVVPEVPVPVRILQREDGQDSIDLRISSWQ